MIVIFRGSEFRPDYSKLGVLCAIFPDVPVLVMTATANQQDRICQNGVGNFNRTNIFYKKVFRLGQDLDAFEGILKTNSYKLAGLQDTVSTHHHIYSLKMVWLCL